MALDYAITVTGPLNPIFNGRLPPVATLYRGSHECPFLSDAELLWRLPVPAIPPVPSVRPAFAFRPFPPFGRSRSGAKCQTPAASLSLSPLALAFPSEKRRRSTDLVLRRREAPLGAKRPRRTLQFAPVVRRPRSKTLSWTSLRKRFERREVPAHAGLLLRPRPTLDPPLRRNLIDDPLVVFGKDQLHGPSREGVAGRQALRVLAHTLFHGAAGDAGVVAAVGAKEDIDRRPAQPIAPDRFG